MSPSSRGGFIYVVLHSETTQNRKQALCLSAPSSFYRLISLLQHCAHALHEDGAVIQVGYQ